jgi:O-antigen/teichoic acid export membrane protein
VSSSDEDHGEGEGVVAGTLFGLLTQATTAIFTAGLTVYLVRELDAEGYGVFSLGVSLMSLGVLAADLAVSVSAGRFMADRRGDGDAVRDVVATAFRLKLISGGVVGVLLAALAGPIADAYGEPAFESPLRWFALALVSQAMLLLWLEVFAALRRLKYSAQLIFVESIMETSASVALVALGGGVSGAAAGRAVGYGTAFILGGLMVARLVGRGGLDPRRGDRARRKELTSYARPLLASHGAYTFYGAIDTQLIALLLTSKAVGIWAAPLRLLGLLSYPALAVATAIAPRMSLQGKGGPDVHAFNSGLRWLIVAYALITVGIVTWAEPIVDLILGDEFARSSEVMQAMGPMIFLLGISPLASSTVNYLGAAGKRLPIILVSIVVNIAIDLALLPTIGVVGAAIGTTAAYLIYVPAHLRLCKRSFEVPYRPLALTLLRSTLAGAAMAAALLLIGIHDLGLAQWLGGALAGPLAFLAVLIMTGELHRDHLDAARGYVDRRLGRDAPLNDA